MEEQKVNSHVAMKATLNQDNKSNEQAGTSGKYSYEDLNRICGELYQQNQHLKRQLDNLNQAALFKRIDYLFEVLSHATLFDDDFVVKCVDEIQGALTVPEADSSSDADNSQEG